MFGPKTPLSSGREKTLNGSCIPLVAVAVPWSQLLFMGEAPRRSIQRSYESRLHTWRRRRGNEGKRKMKTYPEVASPLSPPTARTGGPFSQHAWWLQVGVSSFPAEPWLELGGELEMEELKQQK